MEIYLLSTVCPSRCAGNSMAALGLVRAHWQLELGKPILTPWSDVKPTPLVLKFREKLNFYRYKFPCKISYLDLTVDIWILLMLSIQCQGRNNNGSPSENTLTKWFIKYMLPMYLFYLAYIFKDLLCSLWGHNEVFVFVISSKLAFRWALV